MFKNIFYIGQFEFKGFVCTNAQHEGIIDIDTFNAIQERLGGVVRARTHDVEFAYTGLIKCGHCGCQLTAELKKGKYIYYHCTGKRGGTCKKDWIREEQIDDVMLDLIKSIPKPDSKIFELIRKSIKDARKLRKDYEETSAEEIQKQINLTFIFIILME